MSVWIPEAPGVTTPARRIVLDFAETGVVGQLRMTVHYEGIPEGWAFVHKALCDAAHQVATQWVQHARPLVIQGQGEQH